MARNENLLLNERTQLGLTVDLYRGGAFGIEEDPANFRQLKSGRMSPHYFSARGVLSNVSLRSSIAYSMLDLIDAKVNRSNPAGHATQHYDYMVGSPEAMTSYGAIIAHIGKMALLQPRVDMKKTRGNKSPILGDYVPGSFVVAVDDVVTDGETKIDLVKSLTEQGLKVKDYFVVVDREEGGREDVREVVGIDIVPALGVVSMVEMLDAESMISQTQLDNVNEYFAEYVVARAA